MLDTNCYVQLHVCYNHIYINATMELHMTIYIWHVYTLSLYISSIHIPHKELHVHFWKPII
jgi:hypothetical protein